MKAMNLYFMFTLFVFGISKINAQKTDFCNSLLTVSDLETICGKDAERLTVKIPNANKENELHCNRYFGKGEPSLSKNHLLLEISPVKEGKNPQAIVEKFAKGHESDFYFKYLDDLGVYGVRFLSSDKKDHSQTENTIAFIKGKFFIELKYEDKGDEDLDGFIFSIEQMEAIARIVASRL